MASNHKLTALLNGRTLTGTAETGDLLTVTFTDGSQMTVQTDGSPISATSGSNVVAVRQSGTTLSLDLDVGETLEITTAEETSNVMVRDKNRILEYAD